MAARQTSPRRPATQSSASVPKGARIPQPVLVYWVVRVLFIGALALYLASPVILGWATARGALAQSADRDTMADVLVAIINAAFRPRVVIVLGALGILGVYLMATELALATWGMWRQRRAMEGMPTTYILVRATMPSVSSSAGRVGGPSTATGDQFYRALLKELTAGTSSGRHAGTAPWVAFTLTGLSDQPIAMGVVVADRSPTRRAETVNAIRSTLAGQLPDAQIDVHPDPLAAVLMPGVSVGWREYGLRLPPHYPLRFLDDIAGSDLLGPLAAALAPRGTVCAEAQIIVRPARHWALNWGWRGDATALKLKLEAKQDYALAEDAARIEAKIGAPPFEATIRVVVVADGADAEARVESALNEIARVIGGYHQDTSHHQQELVEIGAKIWRISGKTPAAIVTRAPRFAPPPDLLLPIRTWRRPDILTSLELAGLWHPPSSGLGRLIHWLPCRIIAAPPQAYIAAGRSDRIMVGMARHADGSVQPVGPTLRDVRPPLHITAGMGAGKSRALANITQQCIPHGLILLDGKGDDQGGSLATTVRQYIPLADEHRLIIFDILDTDWPIGLNPLAGIELARRQGPGARADHGDLRAAGPGDLGTRASDERVRPDGDPAGAGGRRCGQIEQRADISTREAVPA